MSHCYVNGETCTLVCGTPGGMFYPVKRGDRELTPELIQDIEECRIRSQTVCVNSKQAYSEMNSTLKYNPFEMKRLMALIGEVIHQTDIAVLRILGAGQHGLVVLMCNVDMESPFVVKLFTDEVSDEERKNELYVAQQIAQAGLGPEIIGHRFGIRHNFLVMHQLEGGMLMDFLLKEMDITQLFVIATKLIQLIDDMAQLKLVHGDLHLGNIAYKNGPLAQLGEFQFERIALQVIDFGFSMLESYPKIDFAALIRSTFINQHPNTVYIRMILVKEYKQRFGDVDDWMDFYDWDQIYISELNARSKYGPFNFYPRPQTNDDSEQPQ